MSAQVAQLDALPTAVKAEIDAKKAEFLGITDPESFMCFSQVKDETLEQALTRFGAELAEKFGFTKSWDSTKLVVNTLVKQREFAVMANKIKREAKKEADKLARLTARIEKKRLADEEKAEKKRLAAEEKAEKKRLADEEKAEKKRLAAEEKKLEREKKAAEKKLVREAEKARKAAEKKAEKERKAAEKKAEDEAKDNEAAEIEKIRDQEASEVQKKKNMVDNILSKSKSSVSFQIEEDEDGEVLETIPLTTPPLVEEEEEEEEEEEIELEEYVCKKTGENWLRKVDTDEIYADDDNEEEPVQLGRIGKNGVVILNKFGKNYMANKGKVSNHKGK